MRLATDHTPKLALMTSGQIAAEPVYRLKRIDFFGRKVPVALQNENGPCPLLAIANILLLKKQIELPEHAPVISQVCMWYVGSLVLCVSSTSALSQLVDGFKADRPACAEPPGVPGSWVFARCK